MAEEVRFELTVGCPTPVFKTGAIDHSATPPIMVRIHFLAVIRYAHYMKYMGIDYGTVRIGVAVSDDTGSMAFPHATVKAGKNALSEVVELVRKNNIEKIIIGESKNFKNEPNDVMEDIGQFKKDLSELANVPVEFEPEFMTSAQALRQGLDKRGAGEKQENLDASAAALILQSYLDRHKVQ